MDTAGASARRQLGNYVLVREAGRGAMSRVHEAVDTRLGRRVALKVLTVPPYLSDDQCEQLITRIKREARAISRLSHPNIVTIYDVGEQEGLHFLVMEYLDGQTLRQRLDSGALPLAEAADLLDQVADALDAVHSQGVVHRDIKPSNVMLLPGRTSPGNGQVKLMDFGVARQADDTTVTSVGMTVGSPAYMAPEQVRGEPSTAASDIWSLGVLLYEMVAGRPPFSGQSIPAVLYQVTYEEPPPLPQVSPAVQKVLLRALEKDPNRRFPSARKLADAFRAAATPVAVRPRRARPTSLPLSSVRPSPRARRRIGATMLGLLAAVAAVLVAQRANQTTRDGARPQAASRPVAPAPIQVTERPPPPHVAAAKSESLPSEQRPPTAPAGAPRARTANPTVAIAGTSEERRRSAAARPRRGTGAASPAPPVSQRAGRPALTGTWRGTHTRNAATLEIMRYDGNEFSGAMTVRTPEGTVRVAVTGEMSPDTGAVRMREERIIAGRRDAWDLGDNVGRLTSGGQMTGTGRDRRGKSYTWSFRR